MYRRAFGNAEHGFLVVVSFNLIVAETTLPNCITVEQPKEDQFQVVLSFFDVWWLNTMYLGQQDYIEVQLLLSHQCRPQGNSA